jgi:large subunit ribosomal protein L6
MSRVGKKPITPPAGVTLQVQGQQVTSKGPKGSLSFLAPDEVELIQEGATVTVRPRKEDDPRSRAMWGMVRAIVANQVEGVSKGFEQGLDLVGVGYRAALQGKRLQLQLGFSHDVLYDPPEGVSIAVPKPTEIRISGTDKQVVGQVAAEIRKFRPPEPYKGKGVKRTGEYVRRKEGKKK